MSDSKRRNRQVEAWRPGMPRLMKIKDDKMTFDPKTHYKTTRNGKICIFDRQILNWRRNRKNLAKFPKRIGNVEKSVKAKTELPPLEFAKRMFQVK